MESSEGWIQSLVMADFKLRLADEQRTLSEQTSGGVQSPGSKTW